MTYMYPNFVPINLTAASLLEPGTVDVGKYGLFLYKEVSALCVFKYLFLCTPKPIPCQPSCLLKPATLVESAACLIIKR